MVVNPLYASVVGSSELESKIYADIANFYGLSKATSLEDLAKKQAQATTTANSLAIAVNNPLFRSIPTVQASQKIAQSQTYNTLANAFQTQTKLVEFPFRVVAETVKETQKQVENAVNEPVKQISSSLIMLAVIAFIFYLVLVKR